MPRRWRVTRRARRSLPGRTIRPEDGQKNGWQKHGLKCRPEAANSDVAIDRRLSVDSLAYRIELRESEPAFTG
jgi:hypothetical protein